MPVKPNAAVWGAHGGRYVQLANILAAEGKWDEAGMVRKLMRERGVAKVPGHSSISLDGVIHEFVADTENLLLDLEEEEKETAIHWHSEKLALAFGLASTEPGMTIHIVKNLRICTDCHNTTKLISKVYGRKVIMRDRSRFHCFTDGSCSLKKCFNEDGCMRATSKDC